MTTNLTGLALVLSLAALAVAGYTVLEERSQPADLTQRLDDLDARLAGIEEALAARERAVADGPSLALRDAPPEAPLSLPLGGALEAGPTAEGAGGAASRGGGEPVEAGEELQALVDEAVERKAAQIQVMRDKKPTIDVFARTLELTDLQRRAVEDEVVRSQHEIQAILETPAADGTNFMDELVEVVADGIARPGQNRARGMQFFGRLMSETIPGSAETYAARIEGVKGTLRETFKRNWTARQYAAFESWQMDPTEIKEIEGSPWKILETRILDRARALGAKLPDRGPR